MKANELRIGNFIHYAETQCVFGISKNKIVVDALELKIEDVTPIELTEDWLLKFGFKPEANYQFDIPIDKDSVCFLSLSPDSEGNFVTHVYQVDESVEECVFLNDTKHVHQLQNLYFALTGEELTQSWL